MYTLHTNLNLLKCHGKGVRKRVNNHKVDHSTSVLNCRNSDAKENTTILQGFAEQEEGLIQGEITHSKKKKSQDSKSLVNLLVLFHSGIQAACMCGNCGYIH